MVQHLEVLNYEVLRIYVKDKQEAEKLCSSILAEITSNPFSVFQEATYYFMQYGSEEKINKYCVEVLYVKTNDSVLNTKVNERSLNGYGLTEIVELNASDIQSGTSETEVTLVTMTMDSKYTEEDEARLVCLLANARSLGGVLQSLHIQYVPKSSSGEENTKFYVSVREETQNMKAIVGTLDFYGETKVETTKNKITTYYYKDAVLYTSIDK